MPETLPDTSSYSEPSSEVTDLSGQVLDERYALERRLGSGGMGVVYAARHVVLGTRLAIKVLRPPPDAHAAEALARFRREARAASALGHPNIVEVKDFGTLPSGLSYYVMEQLDGIDLLDEIDQHEGGLPFERVAHIGRQIAEALGAAHQQGIVHRDLKPENVFLISRLGQPDHVKLIDFGIAKVSTTEAGLAATLPPGKLAGGDLVALARSGSGGRFTAAGIVLGTPHYMSPEQCAGRDVDSRSDLYALGVLLFEATTGATPFDADSPLQLIYKHQHEAPPDPRTLRATVPKGLAELVLHCLEKDPSKRPMGMHEVAERLAMLCPPRPAEGSGTFSAVAALASAPTLLPTSMPQVRRDLTPPRPSGPIFSTQPVGARSDAPRAQAPFPTAAPGVPLRWWIAGGLAVVALSVAAGLVLGTIRAREAASVAAPVGPVEVPAAMGVAERPPAAPVAAPPPAAVAPAPPTLAAPAPTVTPAAPHHVHAHHTAAPEASAPTEVSAPPAPAEPTPSEPPAEPPHRPRPTDAVRDPWSD